MRRHVSRKFSLLGLGGFLSLSVLLSFGLAGSSGCSADDVAQNATSEDAEESADVMGLVVTQAINDITVQQNALTLSGLTTASFKRQIAASERASCDGADLPDLGSGADTFTLTGADFACGDASGSGSCAVRWETGNTSDDLRGTIDCTSLVVPAQGSGAGDGCENVAVNGSIGFEAVISSVDTTVTYNITTISAAGLTLSLASGNVCGIESDFSNVITVDSTSGEGNATAAGCLEACGEAFTISGTENL